MASLEYDPSSTALYVRMKKGRIATSRPLADNIILDLNAKNELVGIEIIGPKLEDLKEFKLKAKILAQS
jgi:uncharacterized protein YuzE